MGAKGSVVGMAEEPTIKLDSVFKQQNAELENYIKEARIKIAENKRLEKEAKDRYKVLSGQDKIGEVVSRITDYFNQFFLWLFGHGMGWTLQIGILLVVGWYCYDKVMDWKIAIQAMNAKFAALDQPTQMLAPPLDESNIQQVFYDKFVLMIDLFFSFLIMLIIAPDKLFQILPFTKINKRLWSGYSELPEDKKQWLAFAWCALVLFVTIYSHSHKGIS